MKYRNVYNYNKIMQGRKVDQNLQYEIILNVRFLHGFDFQGFPSLSSVNIIRRIMKCVNFRLHIDLDSKWYYPQLLYLFMSNSKLYNLWYIAELWQSIVFMSLLKNKLCINSSWLNYLLRLFFLIEATNFQYVTFFCSISHI